jgi:ABC-type polysaccharide/polyol phosphate export permease
VSTTPASATAAAFPSGRRDRLRALGRHVDILLHLVRLDLALRHRGSVLGWVWSLGPPLLLLVATYFLFTRIIPLDIENYPLFLLTGILAWNWFARVLSEGTGSLEARRDLVMRPGFATELIPFSVVLVALVDYLLALPILLVAAGTTSGLHPTIALLPVLLLIQAVLSAGIALAMAPLQVLFRDMRQFAIIAVTLGFWFTPVFYRPSQIPEAMDLIYTLNPMAHLIHAYRQVILDGVLPDGPALLAVAGVSLAVLVAGYALFRRLRFVVPEHI